MTPKLIKNIDGYELFTQGFLKGSTNHGLIDSLNVEEGSIRYKLSLKNCQAIERGYDLDELTNRAFDYMGYHSTVTPYEEKQFKLGYRVAFREALEILGDKKFSEEDVILIAEYIRVASQSTPSVKTKDLFNEYQSLQQTDWDVEIRKEYVGKCKGNNNDGCFLDSPGHDCGCYEYKPKLDATGCLILKLKL
jgi:hypothetical protein